VVLLLVIAGLISSIIVFGNVITPNAYIYQLQGPVTGIRITHDGTSVDNLYVTVAPPGSEDACGLSPCGDTDGTGLWTYHAALWSTSDPIYYFTYAGEGYAFHGSRGQITEVKV